MTKTMTTTKTASPKKLRSGDWGALVDSSQVKTGDPIAITARSGKTWLAEVAKVIWTGDGKAIVATRKPSKRCVTGGNCSSFGSGRSCGAHDCDGY